METLKRIVRIFFDIAFLLPGILLFKMTGKTPPRSYQSLIRLFCMTRGYSNDFFSWLIAKGTSREPRHGQGVLGDLQEQDITRITSKIREKGYYVFNQQLSEKDCEQLLQFALNTPGLARRMDAQDPTKWKSIPTLFKRESPNCVRFDYEGNRLIENPLIQKLIVDPSIVALSKSYLGAEPILDILTMWWHCAFSTGPDSEAAQFFHFDMDRIKWLKFFFYVNDVESENGPHFFIEGSHQRKAIPMSLLKKGYTRLTDEEVEPHFPRDKWIEFTGKRGTIIVEDTRGLHKGKHVEKGDRLVLQFEYTNSLFGTIAPNLSYPINKTNEFIVGKKKFPTVFLAFNRNDQIS